MSELDKLWQVQVLPDPFVFVCFTFERVFAMRFLTAFFLLCSVAFGQALTPFPHSVVRSGETKVVPKGNYLLTQFVTINAGGKLVLDPGVNITVDSSPIPFTNRGTFEINGTASDPVKLNYRLSANVILCAWQDGQQPRPKLKMSHFEFQSSSTSSILILQGTDFQIDNTKLTCFPGGTTATKTVCVVQRGSVGTFANCILDGQSTFGYGLTIGDGTTFTDAVELFDTLFINVQESIRIRKRFALINGTIE